MMARACSGKCIVGLMITIASTRWGARRQMEQRTRAHAHADGFDLRDAARIEQREHVDRELPVRDLSLRRAQIRGDDFVLAFEYLAAGVREIGAHAAKAVQKEQRRCHGSAFQFACTARLPASDAGGGALAAAST